jgi:hypothetical protein
VLVLPVMPPPVVLLVVPAPVPEVVSVRLHPPSAMTSAVAPATNQTVFVCMRSIRKSPE